MRPRSKRASLLPVQGLSFQIWPSSLSLAKYAEIEHQQRPHCWQVPVAFFTCFLLPVAYAQADLPASCRHEASISQGACKAQGMRVLELGCGCGLVGLCFAALGATVLLTDLPDPLVLPAHIPRSMEWLLHRLVSCFPHTLPACIRASNYAMPSLAALQDIVRDNIALNQDAISAAGGSAAAQAFVWGETDVSELATEWRRPDVIVAADVVYRRELFQPLLHALKSLGAGVLTSVWPPFQTSWSLTSQSSSTRGPIDPVHAFMHICIFLSAHHCKNLWSRLTMLCWFCRQP